MKELLEMLTYRRPDKSKSERKFIHDMLLPLGGLHRDHSGNIYRRIGDAPIMFSSHIDTVHRKDGFQTVTMARNGVVATYDKDSNCLGADDTAGVWLMVQMIRENIPGLYVFHRGEEIGGYGSTGFSKCSHVEGIRACIAFDRMGYGSIITHQWPGDCCSDAFAYSLANVIGTIGGKVEHKLDTGGSFTDSANYMHRVSECTNVSVGYFDQHRTTEHLDTGYLFALRDRLILADWSNLEYSRTPEPRKSRGRHQYNDWTDWAEGGYETSRYWKGEEMYYEDMVELYIKWNLPWTPAVERSYAHYKRRKPVEGQKALPAPKPKLALPPAHKKARDAFMGATQAEITNVYMALHKLDNRFSIPMDATVAYGGEFYKKFGGRWFRQLESGTYTAVRDTHGGFGSLRALG